MTTGRINQVNGGTSGNEPSIFGVSHRERTTAREPSPLRARQVRMRVASPFPPWPEGQCLAPSADGRGPSRAEIAPRRERAGSESKTPSITLGRSARAGCREATSRGMILDLHHRHSASTEVQGNAPLLSVTRGEKGTPESSYPLSHIRQDERAGRDSQEAFAQRASKKVTTTATLLAGSLPPIREDQIPGPVPRTRHRDAGRRIHHQAGRSLTATTAKLLEAGPIFFANLEISRLGSGSRPLTPVISRAKINPPSSPRRQPRRY